MPSTITQQEYQLRVLLKSTSLHKECSQPQPLSITIKITQIHPITTNKKQSPHLKEWHHPKVPLPRHQWYRSFEFMAPTSGERSQLECLPGGEEALPLSISTCEEL